MTKLLFSVGEVAEALGISKAKVYELINTGRLPSVNLDRSRKVKSADLLAFVDALEMGEMAPMPGRKKVPA